MSGTDLYSHVTSMSGALRRPRAVADARERGRRLLAGKRRIRAAKPNARRHAVRTTCTGMWSKWPGPTCAWHARSWVKATERCAARSNDFHLSPLSPQMTSTSAPRLRNAKTNRTQETTFAALSVVAKELATLPTSVKEDEEKLGEDKGIPPR
eukprot:3939880-Rhodomonas_salina.1